MKYLRWISENILFGLTLFLLAFIPLYPKKPLLDIKNTWVYVRAEDFVVFFVLVFWVFLLLRKKITLRTPLTLPIMLFWIVGAIATVHGIVLIFPTLANVFPNVSFLSFLRHIEYMSLFFVAFASIKNKRALPLIIFTITITLLLVSGYGFGQKYLGFPAYLTMNEEFAKGIPIKLSALSRVPSTFAGHYDLAAYLVLVIPILASLVFGFRNWLIKITLLITILLGFGLLFMTVSRVSFFVLFIGLFIVLIAQKKRFVLISLPVIMLLGFLFISLQPSLLQRFSSTIKEVDVIIDAQTGESIGHVNFVPAQDFKEDIILKKNVRSKDELAFVVGSKDEEDLLTASPSGILYYENLPDQVPVLIATNVSTGENLPQGTGYINLSLSPVTRRLSYFIHEKKSESSSRVYALYGNFLVKRAAAYDLSFTTRFQGEWPNTVKAFKRNVFFGSGYGSVSLAVDNNYLRILGEIGLLGFVSFFIIFIAMGVYIKRVLPDVDSPLLRSFVIGFIAGVTGLLFNAFLIDVLEASKIAFLLWLLSGVTVGMLYQYQKNTFDMNKELKHVLTSPFAIVTYLLVLGIALYTPLIGNYFVGDDFTWFRWAADDGNIIRYFTHADGFFYRPGTKMYFFLMYSFFWLNQTVYHLVSLILHFTVVILFFFLSIKIFDDIKKAALASFLFLIVSGYFENVFWISSTGHLFAAVLMLTSVLFYSKWEESKNKGFLISSLLACMFSLFFHEFAVVTPLLIILYAIHRKESVKNLRDLRKAVYLFFFIPVFLYAIIRFLARSHWLSGDYNYNFLKFPFNSVGNIIGYIALTFLGPIALPFYEKLRIISKTNVAITTIVIVISLLIGWIIYKKIWQKIEKKDKGIILFGFLFFIISSLPFLGLGNITSRYSYVPSLGLIILLVLGVEKIYKYLLSNGKDIATTSISILVIVFCLFHVIQLQEVHSDWYEAGQRSKRFFTAIDEQYINEWSGQPTVFYFIDVPIRYGHSWVFPVGLEDALWFTFKNDDLRVYSTNSPDVAFDAAENSRNTKVFQFNDEGGIDELVRRKGTIIKLSH